ncbi:hypothetical protein [Absidia glauca]|uniref:Ndc10 domain-containing protein n=1 Tax=Absidia glauca TaxID=4829 RepID=A0A168Q4T0_ABSGL|nr:hypothetical protein [Absidia glauca]
MKIIPPRQAQEWSYGSHRESIGKALSSPAWYQVQQKDTHQLRLISSTTINGVYLTNLPRKLVRSMAGFPIYGRFFYLARAALNPPTSLCKKLFPAIGE